jgi:hypothetical protein
MLLANCSSPVNAVANARLAPGARSCTVCAIARGGGAGAGGGGRGPALPSEEGAGAARLGVLVLAVLLTLLIADLSGLSKAETERIWLPFAMWLLSAGALLPRARGWLAAQAVLALLLNHLLLTGW